MLNLGVEWPPIPVQRLLVTGGRDFSDSPYLYRWLQLAHLRYGFCLLIHGGARGADALADAWARSHGVQPCCCDALWPYYRSRGVVKAAGAIRNGNMLKLSPQLVIAFPGGTGTADMLMQARQAGFACVNLASDYERERYHDVVGK